MVQQRRDVIEIMISGGLVPVFNHDDPEVAQMVVKTCYEGGIRVFEWTNRSVKALDVFGQIREYVTAHCIGMHLGVGSVLDPGTAAAYQEKGAEFLVSPVFDPDLARFSESAKVPYIPGCGSVTEVHQAQKYGAKLVKVFPGNVLGPEFVKAVLGPMPHSRLMPTGGVSPDVKNLEEWFRAGVVCVGMGSQLFPPHLLNPTGMEQILVSVKTVLERIAALRKSS